MRYSHIIFDFDGTIGDTFELVRALFSEIAPRYNLDPISKEQALEYRSLSASQFIKTLKIPRWKIPKIIFEINQLLKEHQNEILLFEELPKLLTQLKNQVDQLYILTSNQVDLVTTILQKHQLNDIFYKIYSTPKLMGKSKYLKKILKKNQLDSSKTLCIGDEVRDIKAAHQNNLDIACVTWGYNSSESLLKASPEFLIHHPQELLNIVEGATS